MNTELQRQRVARFQAERERYLSARSHESPLTLQCDRRLITTRHRLLPLATVAPFMLLAVAGMFDLMFLLTGSGFWNSLSFAMIPAGVIGSVMAVAVWAHDWLAAPPGSRARGVGVWCAIGASLVVTVFVQSWVARFGTVRDEGGVGVVLGFIGAAIALLTGWMLGEFQEHLSALKPADDVSSEQLDQRISLRQIDEISDERQAAHG